MNEPSIAPVEVAVGIVFNPQGQVLFAQRPEGKPYAGWWEFPGGKIEAGESVADALARELHEELGLRIHAPQPWVTRSFTYPHASVRLHFCKVRRFEGAPQSLEQQAFGWSDALAPAVAPILPAALPILPWLALPDAFALQGGDAGLRAPGLPDAVILNLASLQAQAARPNHRWVGAQVGSAHDLALASRMQCDFALAASAPAAAALAPGTPIPLYVIQGGGGHAVRAVAMHCAGSATEIAL